LDSAAATYRRAAEALSAIGDWLRLRAAGVTADSASRAALYATITIPAANARTRWTEALARERTGDPAGAARAYEQLGAVLASLRLRLAAAGDAAGRTRVRRDLVTTLASRVPAGDVPDAIGLLDGNFAPLTSAEELVVARRAALVNLADRAARGFARASRAARLAGPDALAYGTVLARLGRHQEAIARFEAIRDPAVRPQALYQRARSLFRLGNENRALAALRMVRDSFPRDVAIAAAAGWLLADAYAEDGDDSTARAEFAVVARRFPGSVHAERGAFQAALLALIAGEDSAAAREFDAIADRQSPGSEMTAAAYWSGRAWIVVGDTARARRRWQGLIERTPQSYYVVPAARRLGVAPFVPPDGPVPDHRDSLTAAALARAALLDSLGMDLEARFEYDVVARPADAPPTATLATAHELARSGQPARALRLAQRALDRGATPDVPLLRLLYPLTTWEVLGSEAPAAGLPPLLAAALIRQESSFDPAARSRANARGLMQVMPAVGAQIARSERFPEWDPVLLYQPDVNLHLGLRHLAERWKRCGGSVEAALAAYNAGATPVNRWLKRGGTADAEIFIERIPYAETRDYVRRVLYNQARYESLYGKE
jgi:soluble lytic murein transglycosylase